MKLYIAVLGEFPDFMTPTLVAHTVLGAHMKFHTKHELYDDWLVNSFRKVVLRVNPNEFAKILDLEDVYIGHENKTLGGRPSCIVVAPRHEYPNVVKFAKMWKPNATGII